MSTDALLVLPTDLKVEVTPPVLSRRDARTPATLNAIADYLAPQPRYVKRDVDGLPGDETMCNFLEREALKMMGIDQPRLRANELPEYFRSPVAVTDGWTWVVLWIARELAAAGLPVVACQENPHGPGHTAVLKPAASQEERDLAVRLNTAWCFQAGAKNFAHGTLRQAFRPDLPVLFFCHP